jgi:hypothetical protein
MAVITKSLIRKKKTTEAPSTKTIKRGTPIAGSTFIGASKLLAGRKAGGQS